MPAITLKLKEGIRICDDIIVQYASSKRGEVTLYVQAPDAMELAALDRDKKFKRLIHKPLANLLV